MNDRQELLDRIRAVRQEHTIVVGPENEEHIRYRAHTVRLYYQALIEEGFSESEALQLTMTGTF